MLKQAVTCFEWIQMRQLVAVSCAVNEDKSSDWMRTNLKCTIQHSVPHFGNAFSNCSKLETSKISKKIFQNICREFAGIWKHWIENSEWLSCGVNTDVELTEFKVLPGHRMCLSCFIIRKLSAAGRISIMVNLTVSYIITFGRYWRNGIN